MKRDLQWGYLVLRLAVGLDLFAHGAIRIFGHWSDFEGWLLKTFAASPLPPAVVSATAYVIPPVELVLGLLLLFGLRTRETLLAASAVMIGLIFGSCLIQNWELVALQLFYVLIYSVLLGLRSYNFLALDRYFNAPTIAR